MSMNLVSIRDRVAFRVGHVSVSYKGTVLLWGGHKEHPQSGGVPGDCVFPTDELCIFDCQNETWHIRMLTGDIPPKLTVPGAAVLGDDLYVYGGFLFNASAYDREDSDVLYKLDLIKMRWQKLNPGGLQPVACNKLAAWVYGQKVYFFGGFGEFLMHRTNKCDFVEDIETGKAWNNQLVAYNTETNNWEWPTTYGEKPYPRAAHACDVSGSQVFIMGGRVLDVRMEGLYCLNMENMTWSDNLTPLSPDESKPEGRSWHTLTFFAPDRAVVYGGWNTQVESLDECWVMAVNKEPGKFLSWFPISIHPRFKSRRCHAAVPINDFHGNKMIIILGAYIDPEVQFEDLGAERKKFPRYLGRCAYYEDDVPGFIMMSFQAKSLLRLSVDALLEARARTRPFWKELPAELQTLLVTREACD